MEKWLEQHRVPLFLVLVLVILTSIVLFQLLRPQPQPVILTTLTPQPSPERAPTPHPLRVYVSGAVRRPDVYVLAQDSIVKDALSAAGGPADDADLDRINLALVVADGQHVYVPRLGEGNPPVQPPANRVLTMGKVNVNLADLAELESLPGIGPAIAQRIIDYRQSHGPFTRVEEIMDVSGVGPATFEAVRDLITTE